MFKKSFLFFSVVALFQLIAAELFSNSIQDILIFAGINIILALSLNLVIGFTGQFSIGHAGFMAVGGYTSALITIHFQSEFEGVSSYIQGLFLIFPLLIGGMVSAGFGFLVGLPSLRLKGDYLAIVTLGFGEIIRVIILNSPWLGDARGLSGIPRWTQLWLVYLFVGLTLFVLSQILKSHIGRAMIAVREDEFAAQCMGSPVTKTKVISFTVGAFFAGIAGALYAHYLTLLSPNSFDFNRSFEVIIMVVLGGLGSLSGSIVAALFLTFLKEYLRDLREWTVVDLRMIIYSSILIIVMLRRPQGLFGRHELKYYINKINSNRKSSV